MCNSNDHSFEFKLEFRAPDDKKHYLLFCTKCGALLEVKYDHEKNKMSCKVIQPSD